MQNKDIERTGDILINESIRIYDFIGDPDTFRRMRLITFTKDVFKAEGYVYEENGLIKGFLIIRDNYVLELFVDYQFQRSGIGTKLLNYAKELKPFLALHVYSQNSYAIKFYKQQGFSEEGMRLEPHTRQPQLKMIWGK